MTSEATARDEGFGVNLVRHLVGNQFPQLAHLPVEAVRPAGTVNVVYRLGKQLCVRLQRTRRYARDLEKEWRWLPVLAPHLPLRIPEPVARGRPEGWCPLPCAIYRWVPGERYADHLVCDERQAARDLAQFVTELRRTPIGSDTPPDRWQPLRSLDDEARVAMSSLLDAPDLVVAVDGWTRALRAPPWKRPPVWVHTDLLRTNLLADGGRLCAVIDFGGACGGDPAADVIAAWTVFGSVGRRAFRDAIDVDTGTWDRARGLALYQAITIIRDHREGNPEFASIARRTLDEIITDAGTQGYL